jgi:flagellar motor switch protein FliN/FliY
MIENTPSQSGDDLAKAFANAGAAVRRASFDDLGGASATAPMANDIDLVMDVPVQVTVELGRAKMQIRNLLALTQGSVIELDIHAGDPLEVVVNGCLVAQGEVVIVNDRYGIRLTDIVTPAERIRKINR